MGLKLEWEFLQLQKQKLISHVLLDKKGISIWMKILKCKAEKNGRRNEMERALAFGVGGKEREGS